MRCASGCYLLLMRITNVFKNAPHLKQQYSILKLIIISLVSSACFAQGQASVWYFGNQAGLDFTTANPTAITNSQLSSFEGSATLSDAQGGLLMYTNGLTVWNKNHVPMANGTGLFGFNSSSQSAIIVQKPGSSTLFYIFTTNPFEENGGLRYSIVDMSANGETGAVTAKNILLSNSTTEKISVIKHSNGQDLWIVSHSMGNNAFRSLLVTAAGISPSQVVSNAGCAVPMDDDRSNAIGYMKISNDGKKLAICHTFLNKTELFDFNTTTGQVTNGQEISTDEQPYGVEFSPDNNVLYVSSMQFLNYKLYQFNVNAANVADSKIAIASFVENPGALQLAPNGKIYLAMAETDKLTVINNPNKPGSGCNVGVNAVDLGGRISMLGLPSFNQSVFYSKINTQNPCAGDNTAFSFENGYAPTSVSWNFGDATTSNQATPSHQYNVAGNYTVTVTANYPGISISRTKEITVAAAPVQVSLSEQFFCITASQSYNLSQNDAALLAGQPAGCTVSYFATIGNANSNSNPITTLNLVPGSVTVYANIVNAQGCSTTVRFKLTSYAQPVAVSATDFTTCDGMVRDGFAEFDLSTKTNEILNGQPQGNFTVDYFTSEANAEHNEDAVSETFFNTVNPQPMYARISNGNGCYEVVSFNLIVDACAGDTDESAFPKFFTPNGDGYNDTWKTKAVIGADKMKISIFDRYGRHLKTITSNDTEWDGTLNGIALPSDDYWFTVSGENISEYRGHFALKR